MIRRLAFGSSLVIAVTLMASSALAQVASNARPTDDQRIAQLEDRITTLETTFQQLHFLPAPMNAGQFDIAGGWMYPKNGIPVDQTLTLVCTQHDPGLASAYGILHRGWIPYRLP